MKKNKKVNIGSIKGRNIYIDKLGQTIYYDILTKIGYIVEEKNSRTFYIFQNRFLLVIFAVILSADLIVNWKTSIAIGFILCIAFELVFRFWYLPKLSMLDTFVPYKKASVLNGIIQDGNINKTVMKAILYAAFSVLIILNAYTQKMDLGLFLLCIVLSVFGAYYSIIHIIGLSKILPKSKKN